MVEASAVIGFLRILDSGIDTRLINPFCKCHPVLEINVSILSYPYRLEGLSVPRTISKHPRECRYSVQNTRWFKEYTLPVLPLPTIVIHCHLILKMQGKRLCAEPSSFLVLLMKPNARNSQGQIRWRQMRYFMTSWMLSFVARPTLICVGHIPRDAFRPLAKELHEGVSLSS